jgi:hypothetical protein
MREIASGLHRTILPNGWWVNSVRTPAGHHDTVVYDRQGLWAPVACWRSPVDDEGWRTDHLAAVDWARGQQRRSTKRQDRPTAPREDAA